METTIVLTMKEQKRVEVIQRVFRKEISTPTRRWERGTSSAIAP
jgi:hypothetical protein